MSAKFFFYQGKEKYAFFHSYTVIDLETTGFHQATEIIEIGALKVRNQQVIDRFSCFVKPQQKIDPFVAQLTGISNEMVKNASSIQEVLPAFLVWLDQDILLGQNIEYDLSCICRQSDFCGIEHPKNDYADTLTLSRALLPQLKHHKLSALCDYFSIHQERAHRALDDCLATMRVYESLRILYEKNQETLEELNYRCAKLSSSRKEKKKKAPLIFDKNHPFYAKRILFLGTLKNMVRSKAEKEAQKKGAIIVSKVDYHTQYVVIGNYEKNDKRYEKALFLKENGISISFLTEEEFYGLL